VRGGRERGKRESSLSPGKSACTPRILNPHFMCPFHHTSGATQLAKTPEEGGSYTPALSSVLLSPSRIVGLKLTIPPSKPHIKYYPASSQGCSKSDRSSIRHTMPEEQLTILRGGGGTRDECGNCKDVWEVVGTKDWMGRGQRCLKI
jgi:hypothetical protein